MTSQRSRLAAILCFNVVFVACAGIISQTQFNTLNRELLASAQSGNVPEARSLIKEGADVNTQDKAGETPLYLAAEHGKMGMVEFLVVQGANVNLAAKNGQTPLDRAALRYYYNIIQFLTLQGGAANN